HSGPAEAAVDLMRLSGMFIAGGLCEVLAPDGSMAKLPELLRIARLHSLPLVSITDLVAYRREHERILTRVVQAPIPTRSGDFAATVYESSTDEETCQAMVLGDVAGGEEGVLVRLHSECLTGDVFGSLRCDCGSQLQRAIELIEDESRGVVLYVRGHEGRGIGLAQKLRAYRLQEQGRDTVEANADLGYEADLRDYGLAAQVLLDLGVRSLRLMTNNPAKRAALEHFGLQVQQVPLQGDLTGQNIGYLRTKQAKLGHLLYDIETADPASVGISASR
ncbi:MAG: GTP cyclohydrolase II, partial [Actinomycetota bacterium]